MFIAKYIVQLSSLKTITVKLVIMCVTMHVFRFMGLTQLQHCLPSAPADYISVSQQLQFTSSGTEYRVNISIVNDNLVEDVEQFIANLNLISAVGSISINSPQATVNIHSDDSTLTDLIVCYYT